MALKHRLHCRPLGHRLEGRRFHACFRFLVLFALQCHAGATLAGNKIKGQRFQQLHNQKQKSNEDPPHTPCSQARTSTDGTEASTHTHTLTSHSSPNTSTTSSSKPFLKAYPPTVKRKPQHVRSQTTATQSFVTSNSLFPLSPTSSLNVLFRFSICPASTSVPFSRPTTEKIVLVHGLVFSGSVYLRFGQCTAVF